ncbi:MAG: BlaI/MecI/CopY family transcriptional regulator [Bacteroidota bacterium]
MEKLTEREDQIMRIIWEQESVFIKDIVEAMPPSRKGKKPHYNTVATLVKLLEKKGYVEAERIGNTYRYHPIIQLSDYRDQDLEEIKEKYFGNSLPNMLAYFAKSEKLSDAEREELIRLIQSQK